MRLYFDCCCYNRPFDDQSQNLLEPVGYTRFIQQFENGYGDYTKEKYEQPEPSFEELDAELKKYL